MTLARPGDNPTTATSPTSRPAFTKSSARKWAQDVIAAAGDLEPLELVQGVAAAVGSAGGGRDPQPRAPALILANLGSPHGGWENPWLLGLLHEYAVSGASRKSRGAWYTPKAVVDGLVSLALPHGVFPGTVADPTCGGGAFLLASLDRMVELGLSPREAVKRIKGMDIDADAVQVAKLSVQMWASLQGIDLSLSAISVEVGDALDGLPAGWARPMVIVGNPPFASPLRKGAIPQPAQDYQNHNSELLHQYADLAAIHLLAAVDNAGPGSTVVLVQPQSVLASRDTEALRSHLSSTSALESLWVCREAVFDASVRVWAPVVRVGDQPRSVVNLWAGPEVRSVGSTERVGWAQCAARALGAPALPVESWAKSEALGSILSATAGFRDEYYGLLNACLELADSPTADSQTSERLLTVGSVEPLVSLWGSTPTRFGGHDWHRPTVDRAKLNDKVLRWVERQSKPKVVLATQSKILEPVIDFDGTFVPVTPLLALHGAEEDLCLISAVLLAPPIVAWAWEQWFGSAMAIDALKLAAKQVLELPLPPDRGKWEQAGSLIAAGVQSLGSVDEGKALSVEVAALMTEAYRAERHVFEWWLKRLK